MLLHLVLLGEPFEAQTVGFPLFAQQVGMRRAQHHIDDIGKFRQNLRQRVEHLLDALVRREQSEGEQHEPSFHAELVLVKIRIDERNIGNAVRDEIDFGRRRLINLPQHPLPVLRHRDEPGRARDQFLHDAPLFGGRVVQDGVERGHNRHPQFAQQHQHVAAGRSAENAELVLHANDIDIADV